MVNNNNTFQNKKDPFVVVVVVLIAGGTPWNGRTPLERAPDRVLMAL